MKNLSNKLEPFKKKIVQAVAIKDLATAKIKEVVNKGKALAKMTFAPIVKIRDKLSSSIGSLKNKMASAFKAVAVPVTIAATVASVAIGGAVKSGMKLEQQKISMEHFIGATNKDMTAEEVKKLTESFTQELRENANATPFETGDVISAGSRAVAIAGGNTKDAMDMVRLAEDMASASGGTKSISDAIEALADAKMGEMERLKEFGFKISADEFKTKGYEGVAGDLNDFFGGASEKLATSGAGLVSTIKGKLKSNIADFGLNVVEKLKPSLSKIITYVDKMSPTFEKLGGIIADGVGVGLDAIEKFAPVMKASFDTFKPILESLKVALAPIMHSVVNSITTLAPIVMPHLKSFITNISGLITKVSPIISGLIDTFTVVAETLAPVVSKIADSVSEKLGRVADIVAEKMPFVKEVFETTMPIVADVLSVAWNIMSPIIDTAITGFELFASVVELAFPKVRDIISSVWDVIKPIFEGLGSGLEKFSSGVGSIRDKLGWLGGSSDVTTGESKKTLFGSVGKNAKGTDNWKGGLTWVGEEGPELLELPKGSRILPNKQSISFASKNESSFPMPSRVTKVGSEQSRGNGDVNITIPKLADNIIIREEADIDKLGEAFVKEVKKAKLNIA